MQMALVDNCTTAVLLIIMAYFFVIIIIEKTRIETDKKDRVLRDNPTNYFN